MKPCPLHYHGGGSVYRSYYWGAVFTGQNDHSNGRESQMHLINQASYLALGQLHPLVQIWSHLAPKNKMVTAKTVVHKPTGDIMTARSIIFIWWPTRANALQSL